MSHILYGIKTCSTVAKARKWLNEHNIEHQFHDYRQAGITAEQLHFFITQSSWELLLNKRSTTWKNLDAVQKQSINPESAVQLMLENPTLIKRPLLVSDKHFLVGFKLEDYEALL